MPSLIPSSLPVIMQAVEQQLLTDPVVAGDITNIYWVFAGDEPAPGATGQRDIILIQRDDDTEKSVVGGGRFAWIAAGLDINLRSTRAADARGTKKEWMLAHRVIIDALLNVMMGFFPEDAGANALTIEGFVLDTNAAPVKNRDTATWGQTVGVYRFHYMPNIDNAIIG